MSKKAVEALGGVLLMCLAVKVAAGMVSAALPALIPLFVMALVAAIVLRWRSHL
jgi:Na+/glutamate symporter